MEESGHTAVSKQPMLLEVVRQRIRLKHYSHRTERSYVTDVSTTMIYTHVIQKGRMGMRSALHIL
jgi:hypothetical protein